MIHSGSHVLHKKDEDGKHVRTEIFNHLNIPL